jgi:hypothetical protein
MLKKNKLKGLTAGFASTLVPAFALALLAGCGSTPLPPDTGCGVPGGLCAPARPVTSAPPPEATYTPPPAEDSGVRTNPVELPPGVGGAPSAAVPAGGGTRIALLLPLESPTLSQPAEAVRAGFMAAYERDRAGITVNLVPTGDSTESALEAYTRAAAQHDVVVGPLARNAVAALATSGSVSKPTVALNHPQTNAPLPRRMLAVGLALEDEARQVADWAAAEQAVGRALVLSGPAAWQQRLSGAFAARWSQLGRAHTVVELPIADGYVDGNALAELRARLQADPPQLAFAALDATQLRQVRSALGTSLPTYGTASVNPGRDPGVSAPELAGVRILDLPWTVQPDHPAVSVYPRWTAASDGFDMQRLYALGIDAFRIARELGQRPNGAFEIDGVTGRLSVDMGNPNSSFRRVETGVVYRDAGVFETAAFGR